ncbi:MAG: MCE family protein, partial [Actinomycetota bacterium]|nr:MCE family protein [Actinomycetota bacterium]
MKDDLTGAVWRLAIFVVACTVAIVCCVMIFAQLRFGEDASYRAEFTNVTGLEPGNFVRIGGVEVGKVDSVRVRRDAVAVVEFSTDDTVLLTHGSEAAIRYDNLIGGRYLELLQGAGDPARLAPGQTIPLERTRPALDLDALIGGFRPLFRALDPEQVNALSMQLISAFQGQGVTIGAFLSHTASFTSALADRDELIGQVIVNLKTVLGTLSEQSSEVDET